MISRRIPYLRAFCSEFHAAAPGSFWTATDHDLAQTFNGIGAEHWPKCLRVVLTALLRPFQAAALVHDWEYSQPVKSYVLFTAANWRFVINSCLEALDERRPGMIFMGLALAVLCQVFGWGGYLKGGTEHDD